MDHENIENSPTPVETPAPVSPSPAPPVPEIPPPAPAPAIPGGGEPPAAKLVAVGVVKSERELELERTLAEKERIIRERETVISERELEVQSLKEAREKKPAAPKVKRHRIGGLISFDEGDDE